MTDLGTTTDGAVALDVEQLIGSHMAVVANSGGGKSWTIRKVLELAVGRAQRIVLDVEDEFYTLRERAPQLVVAGGENGDCPATVANAAALALFVLEAGIDVVVQINDLGLDGQRAFIAQFLHTIVGAPKALWHPALIVVDEAQRYAPQDGSPLSLPAITSLIGLGRKRGFTAVLASHRLSQINKDVTGHVNNWLLGRVGQSIDRRAVSDALGFRPSSDEGRGLPRLKAGQFWGFGPAIADEPALIQVGRTETTHLKHGQHGVPMPPAPAEIRAMMAKLAAASVQEPPKPAGGAGTPAAHDQAAVDAARIEGRIAGFEEGVQKGGEFAKKKTFDIICYEVRTMLQRVAQQLDPSVPGEETVVRPSWETAPAAGAPAADPAPAARAGTMDPSDRAGGPNGRTGAGTARAVAQRPDGTLPGAQQRILDALAWLASIGLTVADKTQVAIFSEQSPTSGGYFKALAQLLTAGLISYPQPGSVSLTPDGSARAAPVTTPPTTEALHDALRRRLNEGDWQTLAAIIKVYPKAIAKDEIARRTAQSATSGGFFKRLAALRALGLVGYPSPGQVAALPVLFVGGRHG